ncbi:hypothetical protein GIB67_016123 [Kingdonia uniflora]|uniref:Nuclear-pore anchor n=1 Tax=Kingdonia uniflora TaxID=39325 RepID=A0A7J7L279_9MAGN|nr:hypothetical protein GIB67_016123 [Kingdonia uniflora]
MPLFLSDEDFERCSNNVSLVAEKADSFIRDLQRQLETVRAQADAASITAEQTCALLEQRYISLSSDFARLESRNAQLNGSIEKHLSELAAVQAEKHQLHLKDISKDSEMELLSIRVSELQKSKRQVLDLLEKKDSEISEKDSTIKSFMDKIVNLTENAAVREARLHDSEAELARSQTACTRFLQYAGPTLRFRGLKARSDNEALHRELSLVTRAVNGLDQARIMVDPIPIHNSLLLPISVSSIVSAFIAQTKEVERQFEECSSSLKWSKDRVVELETKLTSVQEEFCSSKDAAAANEEHLSAEISTVTKLVELYKESSEEWSRKAGDLEGVIKALETHLSQVESDYKQKLEKEISVRKEIEKAFTWTSEILLKAARYWEKGRFGNGGEATIIYGSFYRDQEDVAWRKCSNAIIPIEEREAEEMKEKLAKYEAEIENNRKANELSLLPLGGFSEETWMIRRESDAVNVDNNMLVPKIPVGVSGTALAASLLRDGWSLAKMYEKYQEAVDSLRHERLGRQQSQAILERGCRYSKSYLGVVLGGGSLPVSVWYGFAGGRDGPWPPNGAALGGGTCRLLIASNIFLQVLFEIEQKAEIILDERAEHERMMEAYSVMNEKLQQSLLEQVDLEKTIQVLKADLRRHERDYGVARKEIVDLQKQVIRLAFSELRLSLYLEIDNSGLSRLTHSGKVVNSQAPSYKSRWQQAMKVTVLVKECRDIQLRCGSISHDHVDDLTTSCDVEMNNESEVEKVISERLLTFKDINGLVEQNVQLRSLVRSFSDENEKRDTEIKERFEIELQKQNDEAAFKVTAVLKRAEEQGSMIESLHTSVNLCYFGYVVLLLMLIANNLVAMYKRLYEEEVKCRESYTHSADAIPDTGRKGLMFLLEGSQEASKKVHEQASERAVQPDKFLDWLPKVESYFGSEATSLRTERDRLAMEANFAREKLDRFMKESEHQREKIDGVLARNVEFSQLIIDYQRKLRDSADSLHVAEELSRKLDMEVSILKNEKNMLVSSEKRALDEVRSLSERVYRLQATIDTIHGVEEVREETRATEIRKKDEHIKQLETEWVQAKKELQEERDIARTLARDKENTIKDAMGQVEEMRKELADASRNIFVTQSRAAVAEARFSDLDAMVKSAQIKDVAMDVGSTRSTSEVIVDLHKAKEEMDKLKDEARANKDHMLQYKNIAQVNEAALKQMESAHESFKAEADKLKKSLEVEILSLRERISELESDFMSKSKEVTSEIAEKEEALGSALTKIANLKEENSIKASQIMGMEIQISSLKEDLDNQHQRWRTSQTNYERQVMLQSETIQELTKTSHALGLLQDELSELRKLTNIQKNESEVFKAKLESEKSLLEQLKSEAEKKYNETDEQNKILHNRLEALHIKLADKERYSVGISSGPHILGEADLQPVVNHLRRSKEIAETEISLLRQEKMRLQSQLENASKASEKAQAMLHSERANSRALVFADEEFKSLQIQIREINLLRESNTQLREENKYNFEECQKLREIAQKARVETEQLEARLREKQTEVEVLQKEIGMQMTEKENLENKIAELLVTCKNINLEDYERMKDDFEQMQVKLSEMEAEVKEARKVISEKESMISNLKQDLANSRLELTEKEKRLSDSLQSEATLKIDFEKQKKQVPPLFKRRLESVMKEKEELTKQNTSLSKQLEKSRILPAGDSTGEQAIKELEKEKDTRIQILEKTLEREREDSRKAKEDLRKEKEHRQRDNQRELKRQMDEKLAGDTVEIVNQEKQKLLEEIETHKRTIDNLLESGGLSLDQLSVTPIENQTAACLLAVEGVEELTNPTTNDGNGARASTFETSSVAELSATAANVTQVPAQALIIHSLAGKRTGPSQVKTEEEMAKRSALQPKPNVEPRKVGRKLVRPRIGRREEPSADIEMPEVDGSSVTIEQQGQSSVRKRSASLPPSELRDELQIQHDTTTTDLGSSLHKKSKGLDSRQKDLTYQVSAIPQENLETMSPLKESFDIDVPLAASEDVDVEKNEGSTSKDLTAAETSELDSANEVNAVSETEEVFDEGSKDMEDLEQPAVEVESDREEGEVLPDLTELEGGSASPEPEEDLNSPHSGIEGETTANEIFDTASPDMMIDDKSDICEENFDEPDVLKGQGGKETIEVEQTPMAALGTGESSSVSTPVVSKVSEPEEVKEVMPAEKSRIINLVERSRQKAEQRRAAIVSPPRARGRGRGTIFKGDGTRGARGGRGGRGGRGQPSSD